MRRILVPKVADVRIGGLFGTDCHLVRRGVFDAPETLACELDLRAKETP